MPTDVSLPHLHELVCCMASYMTLFAIPRLIIWASSACQRLSLSSIPLAAVQVALKMSRPLRLPASSTESQWLYTPAELAHSPSVRAGLTVQQELHGRARAIKRLWTLRNYQTVSAPRLQSVCLSVQRADGDKAIQASTRHQHSGDLLASLLHARDDAAVRPSSEQGPIPTCGSNAQS